MLKHAGYRSKEEGTSVDAWLQHLNLRKQNTKTFSMKKYKKEKKN